MPNEPAAGWRHGNPVDVTFGRGAFDRLDTVLDGRAYGVVTYDEPVFAHWTDRLAGVAGQPAAVITDVTPNPDYHSLTRACAAFADVQDRAEVIVALGGGSAIDTAKVVAASGGRFGRVRRFLETGDGADALSAVPIIAVPTTSGTGSEVTCWATVWDTGGDRKFSLSRPNLYPRHAVVDPLLTVGSPRNLSVSSGLDALSHALESIWNLHATPASRALAVAAARGVLRWLPKVAADGNDIDAREGMAEAALLAGLAFSQTRTALAHALSYPVTLRHGVPHGIACSFSLPFVRTMITGYDADCDDALQQVFGNDDEALEEFLTGLGIATDPGAYGIGADEWRNIVYDALAGERGRNFLGDPERVRQAVAAAWPVEE